MYKYLGAMLDTATLVGKIVKIDMDEANSYYPAGIEIKGKLESGENFILELTVGERKRDDS